MKSPLTKADIATRRWTQTVGQVQQDLLLLVSLVVLMQCARLVYLMVFRSMLDETTGVSEVLAAAARGFQYDVLVSTYLTAPCLLCSLLCLFVSAAGLARIVRAIWAPLVVLVVILASILNGGFFNEFHEQFNHFLLGAGQGYMGPVLETMWTDYHLGQLLLLFAGLGSIAVWVLRLLLRWNWLARPAVFRLTQRPAVRIVCIVFFGVVLFVSARGSIERRPIQLKDADATADAVVNKLVPNALYALRSAVQIHLRLLSPEGLQSHLGDTPVEEVAADFAGHAVNSVNEATQRVSTGKRIKRPSHIFMIVMESADSWPMKPSYAGMHMSDRMTELAQQGVTAAFFTSSGVESIETISALLTGHPDAGVSTNYRPNSRSTYATSLAPQMSALGYRPRLFKGSFLTFQRYGAFAKDQGFVDIIGAAQMQEVVDADVNEWGVNDDVLFDQVAANILDEPTFNFIVSTTYHPPYDLDVESLGFPVTAPPANLAEPCTTCTPDFLHTVGHAWFADHELGDFVEQVSAEHPDALFVITTDHWSRRFITDRPPLWVQVEAPFIMYGPTVLEGFEPSPFFGSHLDIAPTLIELLSPKGHEYNTFGRDMFAQSDEQYSDGADVVLGQGFMARHDGSEVERWAGAGDVDPVAVQEALLWSKKLRGLAWWRIMRGNQLPVGDGT